MASNHNTDHIYKRAHQLAVSGCGPTEVVSLLVREGYPEAVSMFDSELIRADLRQLARGSESPDNTSLLWPRASLWDENRNELKQSVSGTALDARNRSGGRSNH